jgi:hypothetical protein
VRIGVDVGHLVALGAGGHVGEDSPEDAERQNVLLGQVLEKLAVGPGREVVRDRDLVQGAPDDCLQPLPLATGQHGIAVWVLFAFQAICPGDEFVEDPNDLRVIERLHRGISRERKMGGGGGLTWQTMESKTLEVIKVPDAKCGVNL